MGSIEIRTAGPGDKEVVEAVIRSCDLSVDGILAPGTLYLVGCVNAEIIGAIGLEGYGGPACLLRSLAVLPDYRRRGIGAELMNAAHDAARSAGASVIYLFSTGAGAYYQQIGYREVSVDDVVGHLPDVPQVRHYKRNDWLSTEIAWRRHV
jgi:N-acetylglutamate synthase-like GNAT family acetyltransferase